MSDRLHNPRRSTYAGQKMFGCDFGVNRGFRAVDVDVLGVNSGRDGGVEDEVTGRNRPPRRTILRLSGCSPASAADRLLAALHTKRISMRATCIMLITGTVTASAVVVEKADVSEIL